MYKLLFLISISISSFANDLVDLYRLNGIEGVEKRLESELAKVSYWENALKEKDLKFGYFESKEYIIISQKNTKKLDLYSVADKKTEKLFESDTIVGEVSGDKYKENDKKTPEGVYSLLRKKTNLDQFYGPFALVTSYPNNYDKSNRKTGYGIWIHGMPLNETREEYTRGCIAMENTFLEEFESKFDLKKALLLSSENEIKKTSVEEMSTILAFLNKWKIAWKYSDLETYLSFYSKDFKRIDRTGLDSFIKHKTRVFSKLQKKIINFTNINISVYPNPYNKRLFKVFMDQDYKSSTYTYIGKKELILEVTNEKIQILFEH